MTVGGNVLLGVLYCLAVVLGTLAVCVLPGWALIRRTRLDPPSQLLAASMVSLFFVYLCEVTVYMFGASRLTVAAVVVSACLASGIDALVALRRSTGWHAFFPWSGIALWLALSLWMLALQCQIAVYGFPGCYGDWFEHYERTLLFVEQRPPSTQFLVDFALPARGPLFNAVAAWVVAAFGQHDYWCFQIVATVLNAYPVVAFALLLRAVARFEERAANLASLAVWATFPLFVVMLELYTWSKSLSLGFIFGALYLYIRGVRCDRPWMACAALPALGAGFLVHYLVFPYAVVLFLALVAAAYQRRWPWRAVGVSLAASGLVVGSWFVYLFSVFGLRDTLTANATVGSVFVQRLAGARSTPPAYASVFALNLLATVVPPEAMPASLIPESLRRFPLNDVQVTVDPQTGWLSSREVAGPTVYRVLVRQPNLFSALGWTGELALVLAVAWYLLGKWRGISTERLRPGAAFWLFFFVAAIPLNVATIRWYCYLGTVTLNLYALVALLWVFVCSQLVRMPNAVRWLVAGLVVAESAIVTAMWLSLVLHSPPIELSEDGRRMTVQADFAVHKDCLRNELLKRRVSVQMLSDWFGAKRTIASLGLASMAVVVVGFCVRVSWSGDTARNGPLRKSG